MQLYTPDPDRQRAFSQPDAGAGARAPAASRHAPVFKHLSNALETVVRGLRAKTPDSALEGSAAAVSLRQAAVFRGAAIRGRRAMAGNPRNPFAGNRRRADMRANGISGIRRSAPARSR